jgi:CRP-like cAMP-binding protein
LCRQLCFLQTTGTWRSNLANQKSNSLNRVLSQLSAEEYSRLKPDLELVPLVFNSVLFKFEEPIDYVYFPESGVLSMLAVMGTETGVEVGLTGREGIGGLPLFLGAHRSANQIVVQAEGTAMRIGADAALCAFGRGGAFHDAILLFTHTLFLQVSQTTSCNRYHSVEKRLARWLLMMHDRIPSDSMKLTQGFLSWMLGVRNQAISLAAINLQEAGLIKYSRGTMNILNRKQLEEAACDCYRAIRAQSNGYLDR